MADRLPVQELRDAAARLRASHDLPDIKGEIDEDSVPTLNFVVSLLKSRRSLADLLDAIADEWPTTIVHTSTQAASTRRLRALSVARLINGEAS